jgi:hypothetical protein
VDDLRSVGRYTTTWDGRDEHGRAAAAGIYFARLDSGERAITRRIVRLN